MLTRRRLSNVAAFIYLLVSHTALGLASGNCAPYPISTRLGNVTLDNTTARGVPFSVGEPPQHFAFLPRWPLNHTIVFGTGGHCSDYISETACRTIQGGTYNESASKTHQDVPSEPYSSEPSPYPAFSWVADKLTLNSNVTLGDYDIGIPSADWSGGLYDSQAAFGLGQNSSILNALYSAGHIASRSWAMFWGKTGATADTQQPGSFVFGGFDRAKASGEGHTDELYFSNSLCSTGMLVTVTDMVLDFANGTQASLFDDSQSIAMSACIEPDYPGLMTLPYDPYLQRFQDLTQHYLTSAYYSVYYTGMLYDHPQNAYTGDFTITFSSGFSIRIPNDQLVLPVLTMNYATGALQANGSALVLVIDPTPGHDVPKFGRQLLSSSYLMVNQDAGRYTFWEVNLDKGEDLVAVDEKNRRVDRFCFEVNETPATNDGLSKGAIAGIVVGCVAGVALIAGIGYFHVARKRKLQSGPRGPTTNYERVYAGVEGQVGGCVKKPDALQELPVKPDAP